MTCLPQANHNKTPEIILYSLLNELQTPKGYLPVQNESYPDRF